MFDGDNDAYPPYPLKSHYTQENEGSGTPYNCGN